MSWRLSTKSMIHEFIRRNNLQHLDSIYMFGVYTGESVWDTINIFGKYKYFLFDSFEGLPEEAKEPIAQDCWCKGEFNAMEKLGCSSIEETIESIDKLVRQNITEKPDQLNWIPGYFNESLPRLIEKKVYVGPAAYVDIDCDLYSSTIDALDWLLANKIIRAGTILGYDDWGGTPGWFANVDGESRAHKEMSEKYGMKCTKIFQAGSRFPHVQTMFVVTDLK